MAGYPVYVVLHLVIIITPLLNACPHPAALTEWGGRRWFGKVSQENAGGNGSKLDDEKRNHAGTAAPSCEGRTTACLLYPR